MFILGGMLAISVGKPWPISLRHTAANIIYSDLEPGQIQVDSHRSRKSISFAFTMARFLSMILEVREFELFVDRFLTFLFFLNTLTKPCFSGPGEEKCQVASRWHLQAPPCTEKSMARHEDRKIQTLPHSHVRCVPSPRSLPSATCEGQTPHTIIINR